MALPRHERLNQVASAAFEAGAKGATCAELARVCGMKKTPHFWTLVDELVDEGTLIPEPTKRYNWHGYVFVHVMYK